MEDKEEDFDEDIISEAEYSPKSEYSKPALLFEVSQRCALLRAKEMRKGYFNTSITKDGLRHQVWIEDSRKVYCSAVKAFEILLIPEILEDDKFKDMDEDFETLFGEYAYYKIKKVDGRFVKDETNFYMPEVDAPVEVIRNFPGGEQTIENIPAYWNKFINLYWDEKVLLSDVLFKRLMVIIHRKNYFKRGIR